VGSDYREAESNGQPARRAGKGHFRLRSCCCGYMRFRCPQLRGVLPGRAVPIILLLRMFKYPVRRRLLELQRYVVLDVPV
jgi:hypothetical protein